MVAPVTTLQTLYNGVRNLVVKATFVSGGADQPLTTIVDNTGVLPTFGKSMKVTHIRYDITPGGLVRLYWDAPSPVDMVDINGFDHEDYTRFGGLKNGGGANATGDILVSTQGFTIGYSYTVVLEMIKGV